jgi:predicted acetyltransferase
MRHQLDDIRQRGEPIALLWASEGRIYQRFGYGLGAQRQGLAADTRETRLVRPVSPAAGRLRDANPEQVGKDLQQVYERVRPGRPGWSSRDDRWWVGSCTTRRRRVAGTLLGARCCSRARTGSTGTPCGGARRLG